METKSKTHDTQNSCFNKSNNLWQSKKEEIVSILDKPLNF